MADDEELGNWDDEGNEGPAISVVKVETTAEVDLTVLEAKKREEEARQEALKPKPAPAAAPAKATRAAEGGGGGGGGGGGSSAFSGNMTEAEREEAQRKAEAASTQEMVSGLTASRCSEWAPKLIIASMRDLEDLGRTVAERVHTVRGCSAVRARAPRAPPHLALVF
jgi:hypothetical protein